MHVFINDIFFFSGTASFIYKTSNYILSYYFFKFNFEFFAKIIHMQLKPGIYTHFLSKLIFFPILISLQ